MKLVSCYRQIRAEVVAPCPPVGQIEVVTNYQYDSDSRPVVILYKPILLLSANYYIYKSSVKNENT